MFNVQIEGYDFNTNPLRARNNYHETGISDTPGPYCQVVLTMLNLTLHIRGTIAIAIVSESFTIHLCFK